MSGLAEQMLAIVVENEVPELESQRQDLIHRMSEGRLMLKVQRDYLLLVLRLLFFPFIVLNDFL